MTQERRLRAAAWILRFFAYGLIAVVATAAFYAPEVRERLGPDSWLAQILPTDTLRLFLWVAVAVLNAGATFHLAAYLERPPRGK